MLSTLFIHLKNQISIFTYQHPQTNICEGGGTLGAEI